MNEQDKTNSDTQQSVIEDLAVNGEQSTAVKGGRIGVQEITITKDTDISSANL